MKKHILIYSILNNVLIITPVNITWPWEKKQPQGQSPIIYTIARPNNTPAFQIKLVQGDLLNLGSTQGLSADEQYTIVNTANKFLYLGGGIAGAIKKTDSSGTVQADCNNLLIKHGKTLAKSVKKSTGLFSPPKLFTQYMPVGTAWLTTSGDLKKNNIHHIIHAVCPDCRQEQEQHFFEDFLRMAYGNIITIAISYNSTNNTDKINTIACPSLSTGIFECPIENSAHIAAERICTIMKNLANTNNAYAPTTFIMVAYSEKDFQIYKKAFDNAMQNDKAMQNIIK